MQHVAPAIQPYPWGSASAIPKWAGWQEGEHPVAEAWYGAHPGGPARLVANPDRTLTDEIAADPVGAMGQDVVERFGPELPFLLKVIAPAQPLSLQVHPTQEQAALGWVREERSGIAVDAPERTFRDANHKPELVYALEPFEAVNGFRAPRRVLEVLAGLEAPLIEKTVDRVRHGSSVQGMRSAFEYVLLGARDRDRDVSAVVEQIRARLARGESPSVHSDSVALKIADTFPGDRGILASLLLNPVSLRPGEVLFVPAGGVHAYLSGLAVELMAASDNVVRAGLTHKHIDARALVDIVDVRPAPPIRIAPERLSECVEVFYAPVEDFELTVLAPGEETILVRGAGPRLLLGVADSVSVRVANQELQLTRGGAAFLRDDETAWLSGPGRAVLASVP